MNTQKNMSNEQQYDLHEYRLTQLETNHLELKKDMEEIKVVLYKLDKKLTGIPDTGIGCGVHQLKMDDYAKRLDVVEKRTDDLTRKIIIGTTICSVILFLLSQVVIPYITNNFHVAPTHKASTYFDGGVTNQTSFVRK